MIVKSWREAFSTAMRDSGDSWEMVEWKSMSDTWLDSRSCPEWDEDYYLVVPYLRNPPASL